MVMTQTPFEAHAPEAKFDPVQQWDPIPGFDENAKKLKADRDAYFDQLIKQEMAIGKGKDKALMQLAQFAPTAAKLVGPVLAAQRDQKRLDGAMKYKAEGAPLAAKQRHDLEESLFKEDVAFSNAMAAEAERQTGNFFLAEGLRKGNEEYGYTQAALQDAAINYPLFYHRAADKYRVEVPPGSGQYKTLNSATSEERPYIEQKIAEAYTRQFSDLNPVMLDKYLFPGMRKFEMKTALKYANDQRDLIQERRKTERQETLLRGLRAGDHSVLINHIVTHEGEFGNSGARADGLDLLSTAVRDGKIDASLVAPILDHPFPARGGDGTKTTTLRELWPSEASQLQKTLEAGYIENINQKKAKLQADGDAYVQEVYKFRAQKDGPFTEDDKRQALSGWNLDWGPVPADLNRIATQEDELDDDIIADLQEKERKNIPITQKDVDRLTDYDDWNKWKAKVNNPNAIPTNLQDEADELIPAFVNQYTNENDADKSKTPKWVNIDQQAKRAYNKYYAEAIKVAENSDQAHLIALEKVKDDVFAGKFNVRQKSRNLTGNIIEAKRAWSANPSLISTAIIPGTEDAFASLKEFSETGVGSIPLIYYQLAASQKGFTAIELANLQLQSQGLKPLTSKALDEVNNKPEEQKILIKFKPTKFRISRYQIMDEGGNFNDEEYLLPGLAMATA